MRASLGCRRGLGRGWDCFSLYNPQLALSSRKEGVILGVIKAVEVVESLKGAVIRVLNLTEFVKMWVKL